MYAESQTGSQSSQTSQHKASPEALLINAIGLDLQAYRAYHDSHAPASSWDLTCSLGPSLGKPPASGQPLQTSIKHQAINEQLTPCRFPFDESRWAGYLHRRHIAFISIYLFLLPDCWFPGPLLLALASQSIKDRKKYVKLLGPTNDGPGLELQENFAGDLCSPP